MTPEERAAAVRVPYYFEDVDEVGLRRHIASALREAVAEEREACALLAESMASPDYTAESGGGHGAPADGLEIGAAIRCRGD